MNKPKNPWKTLKKNVVYKNIYGFVLRDDDVVTPAGTRGKYLVLEHRGYAAVVPITKDNQVILVRQWRYPIEEECLEVPAGALNDGENPLDAAKRELKEEAGGVSDSWQKIGEYWQGVGSMKIKGYVYLAKDVQIKHKLNLDEEEDITVELWDFQKAIERVIAGEIPDSKTQLALLLAREKLKS